MKSLPILLIDFDGVIHRNLVPWEGPHVVSDVPEPGAIEWLAALVKSGQFSVQIWSSRNRSDEGVDAMAAWLVAYGLDEEVLDQIGFPYDKMPAHLTIDDRAWCFTGTFPSVKEIADFKPWRTKE